MCSVGDDNSEDSVGNLMPKIEKIRSDKCNKCRTEQPTVVLRNKDCYCKNCFLTGTVHKFKALLGKHRLLRPNDKVLIYHKPGQVSAALLHFLRTGIDLTTPKKLRFEPVVLYIDDQLYFNEIERHKLALEIEEQVKTYGFKMFFISLNKYISQQEVQNILVAESKYLEIVDKDALNEISTKKCSTTNKKDIIANFRRQLLLDVAKHLGCKFIFVPEIAMDVASNLLTNISLGRGEHISLDAGFSDTRDKDVTILRPLRQFDIKELTMYNVFNNIQPVSVREYQDETYSSVQSLMGKFIKDLQVDYPATITTIVKTSDKLGLNNNTLSNRICKFCKAPLENKSNELTSAESTQFSHWVSTHVPDYTLSSAERYEKLLSGFKEQKLNHYCYTCDKLTEYICI